MMKKAGIVIWLVLLLLGTLCTVARTETDPVIVIEVKGVINPLSAQYLDRIVRLAGQRWARAVVITLDTPGGLESAMREMVQTLMESPLPTVVYVAPRGARATSAGMFIAQAAHVAAMAPATHIGAAHPVPLGTEVSEVADEKMVSDAAALARSVATTRGRNAEWVELAIRKNLSITADEALELGVVDLIAEDLDDLLHQLNGLNVVTARGEVVLQTQGAMVEYHSMNLIERLLHVITDPNIAYLLLSLGTLFLLAELADPGLSVAGIASVVSFVVSFTALGSLPVNWAGMVLLALSVVLFVVGLLTDAEAVVTAAGLVPFVLGSLLLFSPFTLSSPAMPTLRVNPWLIGATGVSMLAFSLVVLRAVITASRMPPKSGAQRLVGRQGTAMTDLTPGGQVRVDLEEWSAVAVTGEIRANDPVQVVGVAGIRLQVVPVEPEKGGEPRDKGGA